MKKRYIIATILILSFAVIGISCHNPFADKNQKITPEEAEKLCCSVLGEKDEKTGFTFSFAFTETIEKDEKEYHVIRTSWLVNNSHMSYIGDFFVSTDGKEIYTGVALNGEYEIANLIWSK